MSLRRILEMCAQGGRRTAISAALGMVVFWSGAGGAMRPTAIHAEAAPVKTAVAKKRAFATLARLPLSFESNVGQVGGKHAAEVKYLARAARYTVYLTGGEAVLSLARSHQLGIRSREGKSRPLRNAMYNGLRTTDMPTVLSLRLSGANRAAKVAGFNPLPGKSNYFIGNNPAKWHRNISTYAKVRYEDVYPGIDLVYYGNQGRLEYDFVVRPGADPNVIKLDVGEGSALPWAARGRPYIATNGDLVIQTRAGDVRLNRPVVYQPEGNRQSSRASVQPLRKYLDGRYLLRAIKNRKSQITNYEIAFKVSGYDRTKPLVIDPVLSFSTYLGGSLDDAGMGIALDSAGNIYVAGSTGSANFPTASPFQPANGGADDAFIAKLDPTGSQLLYSTYLGGSGNDSAQAIALDSAGDVFLAGTTSSSNFPTISGAPQIKYGGGNSDAFVAKLKADGSALVYSTYLGGSGADFGRAIALDSAGNAYVAGDTQSTDFPTAAAFQSTSGGGDDAFVSKLNPTGSSLVYSTYLGGSGGDSAQGIAVDSSGNAFLVGTTLSTNFPTSSPFQTASAGNSDVFVSELNSADSALVYSTYLGGRGFDRGAAIALDASGNSYVTGDTTSMDITATPGAMQTSNHGNGDAFVAKINAAGASLAYFTYLGGAQADRGNSIAVDGSGDVFVAGYTQSGDFPVSNAVQATFGGGACGQTPCSDAFVTEINLGSTTPVYSTFLGRNGNDFAQAVALDSSGGALVTGGTASISFPVTAGALQSSYGGSGSSGDAFVARVGAANAPSAGLSPQSLTFPNQAMGTTSAPLTVTLSNFGTAALNISSITANGDFAVASSGTTCSTSTPVAPGGANCVISVTFSPTTTSAETGTLTITDDAAGSPQTVPLSGTGVTPAPAVSLTPSPLTFADQAVGATSAAQALTLTNTGSATLTISKIAVTGDFAETDNCGTSVAAGSSCVFNVTFTPTASGSRTGQITVTDNATGSPHVASLDGMGVAVFLLSSNPASAIISQGTNLATFTISSAAPSSFTSSINLTCSGSSKVTCSFNPASITPGQTSTLTLSNLTAQAPGNFNLQVTGTSGSQNTSITIPITFASYSTALSPPLLTIPAGRSGSYTLTLAPLNGFNGAVTLNCGILPIAVGTVCKANPSSVTPDGTNPVNVSIDITTTARTVTPPLIPRSWPPGFGFPMIWVAGFLTLLISLWFLSRRSPKRVFLVLVLVLVGLWAACGGGSANQLPPGTPAGDYSVLVTATSGSLSQTVQANLVIQ